MIAEHSAGHPRIRKFVHPKLWVSRSSGSTGHPQGSAGCFELRSARSRVDNRLPTKPEHVMRSYSAVIERCAQTRLFVGFVPGFAGAHSQGETLEELNRNLQEVITMLLEDGRSEERRVGKGWDGQWRHWGWA